MWSWRWTPASGSAPRRCRTSMSRPANGTLVPLSAFTRYEPTATALAVNHQGQFPSVTISFNLAPGVALGDAVKAIEARHPADGDAGRHPGQLFRHGPGLPGLPGQRAAADPGGTDGGLYRARHPVRELYPPDHHPLHPALGRRGGDPGPDALPHRSQHYRHHRHYAADRHRQEERHHDGRFRPGGRAQAREEPRRRRSSRPACSGSGRS